MNWKPVPGETVSDMFDRLNAFLSDLENIDTEEQLAQVISEIAADLGFRYFALTDHVDLRRSSSAIRIHNYPGGWAEWFDEHSLGVSDPVHRASNISLRGFTWAQLPGLIPLTRADRHILKLARAEGIGEGYTVPANVPGEAHGSCSFACATGAKFSTEHLNTLQLIGLYAFDAARKIRKRQVGAAPVKLTDRQREVVICSSSGMSDKQIGRILGISENTVGEHMRNVCHRYGVKRRTQVTVSALADGTIGFQEILKHRE